MKPLIRGLVDRKQIPPAANLQGAVIEVRWSALEPLAAGLVPNNHIDTAIAAAGCTTPLRIRVLAGMFAPDWVKQASGIVNVTNPFDGKTGTVGQFWTDPFRQAYDNLQTELAAKYDSLPNLDEVVVSRCSMFYPEPFLRGTSIASNVKNLRLAGYTLAADQQCQLQEIDSTVSAWTTARVGVSFNPYQVINSDGTTGVDESFTEQVMGYCRYTAGQRCVLENDSIRDPISGLPALYGQMYAVMSGAAGPVHLTLNGLDTHVQMGAPIAFQTAVAARIGDFWGTLVWARQHHAASVELPVDGYPLAGGAGAPAWQTLAEVAQWFQEDPALAAMPAAAVEGSSTRGLGLANLTLDETAAVDTMAGYGDVGSVPFDTVSAEVDWPDGAVEPALVAIGQSPPAVTAMCSQQPCNAVVQSGGHQPLDEASAAAAVHIALTGGGVTYLPADGISLNAAPAISVADQPLTGDPVAFSAVSGATYSGPIGSFQDSNVLASALDGNGTTPEFSFSIDWGDRTALDTSTGTFTIGACGTTCPVQLNGIHTYANSGTYAVSMVVADGPQRALTFTSTANVASNGCTSASLSPTTANLPPGRSVSFTAGSTGCTAHYKFWLGSPNGTWAMLRDWGGPTFTWNVNPAAKGHYKVHVWANSVNASTAKPESWAESTVNLVVCASASLTPPGVTKAAGQTVSFVATSTGCVTPKYEYWIGYSNGTWQLLRGWGSGPFDWVTKAGASGTYTIHIWANNTGDSTAKPEAYGSSMVTLTP
jgi:hypothetical protein